MSTSSFDTTHLRVGGTTYEVSLAALRTAINITAEHGSRDKRAIEAVDTLAGTAREWATGLLWGGLDMDALTEAVGQHAEVSTHPVCPSCGHELMAPTEVGEPGDNSYYCEGCGRAWTLDLKRQTL
jgi:predicted RNA-binding Zn-ribbon protein involved in translation (DUF1610 family)